jgi:uncharacterized protein
MRFLLPITFVILIGLLGSCDKKANNQQKEIKIEKRIFDSTNVLTTEQKDSIFQILKTVETDIGSEIIIIIADSISEEEIPEYSLHRSWELKSRKELINGLLVVVSAKNAETMILIGHDWEETLEGDTLAKIIREDMMPKFQKKDFSGGLRLGIQKIKTMAAK